MEELFWTRTNRIIKESGFTQETLTQKCGFSDPRRIQNLSGRGSFPKAEEIVLIAKELRISTDYLLTGKDSLYDDERELLKAYNNLNEAGKKAAIGAVRGLVTDFPLPSEQAGASSETAI